MPSFLHSGTIDNCLNLIKAMKKGKSITLIFAITKTLAVNKNATKIRKFNLNVNHVKFRIDCLKYHI